jgi:MFS superfamily sulfate permease-like transporter
VTILVILWLGRMFESLPKDCLASIIVVALKNLLFQVKDLYFLWRPNKIEFITWLGTFLGVVIFDIDIGLVIGLTLSILVIVIKDQYVQIRTLVPYNDAYIDKCFVRSNAFKNHHSSESTEQAHEQQKQKLVHAKIFKIQNSIYFINCQSFQLKIYKKYGRSPLDLQRQQNFLQQPMNETSSNPTQHETRLAVSYNNDIESNDNSRSLLLENIILDFSAVNYVDTSGVKAIRQLIVDYKKVGVSVFICRFQHNFLRVLHGMNVLDDLNGHIYLAIDDALKASLKKYSNSKNPNSNVINHHHHNNNN